MRKPKAKTIIKYLILAYAIYLIYSLPKTDWEAGEIIFKNNPSGTITRYVPQQSSYVKYMGAWWSNTFNKKGITGIVDEHILAPLGITV